MTSATLCQAFRRKRVLITGGLGFIGANLARRLAATEAEITLVDSLVPEYGGNLFNISGLEDRLRINISDVRDEHSLAFLVQGQDYLLAKSKFDKVCASLLAGIEAVVGYDKQVGVV